MTGLYQQHHNRPGFELFSVVEAKSKPELYLFGMVESLHGMELIHQDANAILNQEIPTLKTI